MMWNAETINNSIFDFSNIEPLEVLLDFEGPQIYTFSIASLVFLAYTSAIETNEQKTLLVTAITASIVADLKGGILTIHKALDREIVWRVDVDAEGQTLSSSILINGINDIPREYLPSIDATLTDADPSSTEQYSGYVHARVAQLVEMVTIRPKVQAAHAHGYPSMQRQASRYAGQVSREYRSRRGTREFLQ